MKSRMMRILLADDNPSLRSALVLLLETRLNARVVGETYRMEDLLICATLMHPDLVILDWELPGAPKTGRVAALHETQPSLKVVVTSSQPDVQKLALAAQADAFVCKSEPPEQMVRVLATLQK